MSRVPIHLVLLALSSALKPGRMAIQPSDLPPPVPPEPSPVPREQWPKLPPYDPVKIESQQKRRSLAERKERRKKRKQRGKK